MGESAIVELRLDTEGMRINAADIHGEVSGDAAEILNLETAGSIFAMFPERPSVSGKKWSISGGIPGGFTGDAVIGKLAITAGAADDVKIYFDADSRVFLHGPENSIATLKFASAVLTVAKMGGDYLRITSASHPKQSEWNFEKNLYLTWQAETGSDYSYKLSRLPNELPDGVADLPVGCEGLALEAVMLVERDMRRHRQGRRRNDRRASVAGILGAGHIAARQAHRRHAIIQIQGTQGRVTTGSQDDAAAVEASMLTDFPGLAQHFNRRSTVIETLTLQVVHRPVGGKRLTPKVIMLV